MNKKQTAKKAYQKELTELINKKASTLDYHVRNCLKSFGEEVFKLNMKYFEINLTEVKE